ncbi:hypothetical protein XM38_048500 [Halomicronema hongdechloris C2206]|uniref:Uncharacterized protein n=1 Tax=Halomicronema hongdechloris C2206 TaxID=1641165 RepID=A0A1Z3HUB8_9CYAN|nr:hypothetical protein XM38_048500 [Halomicronema hongdechloris C2206]
MSRLIIFKTDYLSAPGCEERTLKHSGVLV